MSVTASCRVRADSSSASAMPSAAGSSPTTRSTHEPSSAATSAVSRSPSWCAATGARQAADRCYAPRSVPRRRVRVVDRSTRRYSPARTLSASDLPCLCSTSSGRSVSGLSDNPRREVRGARTIASTLARPACEAAFRVPAHALDSTSGSSASSCSRRRDAVPCDPWSQQASRAAERIARVLARQVRTDGPPWSRRGIPSRMPATSIRRESASRLLTKRPRAISPNGFVRSVSPAVLIGTSAISTDPAAARRRRQQLRLREREPTAARPDADQRHTVSTARASRALCPRAVRTRVGACTERPTVKDARAAQVRLSPKSGAPRQHRPPSSPPPPVSCDVGR